MDEDLRQQKNKLFHELKPYCVRLSQLALKDDGSASSIKALTDVTEQLQEILHNKCRGNNAFDDNLANYVFFPLSHVLRLCQKRTGRLAELATRCLRELLEYGWRTVAVGLGHQLLILLTFFAGGGPSVTPISEELQEEALGGLGFLFKILHNTPKGAASLVEASFVPTLGQCLTVILDGITNGPSSQIQLEALLALGDFWSCIKDRQALSNFLPGTVSALTKCLTPTTKVPRSCKVLTDALQVFQNIITTTLSDVATRGLQDDSRNPKSSSSGSSLTQLWLIATATQIKLALASVIKLRKHDHQEVRRALETMCLTILDECHVSLPDSATLLVETALSVSSSSTEEEGSSQPGLSLHGLAIVYPSISVLVKDIVYNWITSLPRIMQGSDELAKQFALRQISKAQDIYSDLGQDSTVLNDALIESLRNSVVSLLELLPSTKGSSKRIMSLSSSPTSLSGSEAPIVKRYRPILMPHGSQTQTQGQLDLLITNIGSLETRMNMARSLLIYMRDATGTEMLSTLWLAFHLVQAPTSMSSELDPLIQESRMASDEEEAVLSELYAYAVSNLSIAAENDKDWRIHAISLEIVAYAASVWGEAFQLDLVDTIYPIVHLFGSQNTEIREHAITTLNLMSHFSGYSTTSEMIISNADYLVNAISLKLNTFDISPQAPQVLMMMINLSGSSILPYLDDVVGSIFAALDNFHGYPRLVESLFNVLGEIVEQSGKSGQLQLLGTSRKSDRKEKPTGCKIEDVLAILTARMRSATTEYEELNENFPAEPWKDASAQLDEIENPHDLEEEMSTNPKDLETHKSPPTKLYTMVQNITRLSQHYLTNQSPQLRARLLDLVYTANRVLQQDEDHYLPLVNDVWPVLIKRLYDEEPFVIIAASRAIAETCICAGDFMSTRIQAEWHAIMKHVRHAKIKAAAEKNGRHGRGIHSQSWQVWEALVKLLIAIVEYVHVEDDIFDEALEVLADIIESREDVRDAFCAVNADAVWLLQLQQGQMLPTEAPATTDIIFADIDMYSYD